MKIFKKIIFLPLAALLLSACGGGGSSTPAAVASTGWAWMGGNSFTGGTGFKFSAKSVPSTLNIPSSRSTAVNWIDARGDLWLFGGSTRGVDTFKSDLWRYNTTSKEWTWVSGSSANNTFGIYGTLGVADAANRPGARLGPVSWKDANNNLWMHGGFGLGESNVIPGILDDLWKFDIQSGLWTWVAGGKVTNAAPSYILKDTPNPANTPGGLVGANSWTAANGNLWIFGGAANAALTSTYNNLWEFDIASASWIFRGGDGNISRYKTNTAGIYGDKTVANAANQPGSRLDAVSWVDGAGNLWMFGGSGFADASATQGLLSDLWKYDMRTRQWTWMQGNKTSNAFGVYGTAGVSSALSAPGARWYRSPISWTDGTGNFWMFGGEGNGTTSAGLLNDLWKYDATANQWTWMSGAKEPNGVGAYGTLGLASDSSQPGARKDVIGWVDAAGSLWIFGGYGYDTTSIAGYLNDVWKFTPGK